MPEIDREKIQVYRQGTYRCAPSLRLHSQSDAVSYVNHRGFVFFWPIKGISMPSLWVATAGDRPVADEHDDPGHITWNWKDELLGKGIWYYGRVLARKNCMISLDCLPSFYALSPNFGDPENEYLDDYRSGYLSLEAKNVYEALLGNGALDSITLRKSAHLTGAGSESRFNKALEVLQTSFRIAPCGTSKNGAWHYSFVYDVFHRQYGNAINQSREISESSARTTLLEKYIESVGCCSSHDISRVFRWSASEIHKTIQLLVDTSKIITDVRIVNEKEDQICLSDLF